MDLFKTLAKHGVGGHKCPCCNPFRKSKSQLSQLSRSRLKQLNFKERQEDA